jgi:hypothetical protein
MRLVTELDLHSLPIGEQLFANDPNPHMIAALERHSWLATSDFGIIITDNEALAELMLMDAERARNLLRAGIWSGYYFPACGARWSYQSGSIRPQLQPNRVQRP